LIVLDRLFSPVEARTTVARQRDDAFRTIADPRTYPSWLVGAQRIRRVDPDFPAPAAEFEHSVGPSEGATVDDSSEVLVADPPRRLDLAVHVGPLDGDVTFLLEESGGRTTVTLRERPTGRLAVLTPLLRPALYARNRWSLHRLRRLLEGSGGPDGLSTLER
jgi:uncharacterized protein YndB with AHSA1/START domain